MSKLRNLLHRARRLFLGFREGLGSSRHEEAQMVAKLLSHDEVYDKGYFQFVEQTSSKSSSIIANSVISTLNPLSVVDVGCGTGVILEQLRSQGVQVRGMEYAEAAI